MSLLFSSAVLGQTLPARPTIGPMETCRPTCPHRPRVADVRRPSRERNAVSDHPRSEVLMSAFAPTPRRGFLARLFGTAAALGAGSALGEPLAAQQPSPHDKWLTSLTAPHRCLFDFPLHGGGLPLIHMYNYITTYRTAYGENAAAVNAIGSF